MDSLFERAQWETCWPPRQEKHPGLTFCDLLAIFTARLVLSRASFLFS